MYNIIDIRGLSMYVHTFIHLKFYKCITTKISSLVVSVKCQLMGPPTKLVICPDLSTLFEFNFKLMTIFLIYVRYIVQILLLESPLGNP